MASDTHAEPEVRLLHVTTGPDGLTQMHRCRVPAMQMGLVGPTIPPVWYTEPRTDVLSSAVWVLPPGWHGGWHPNPARQWVIPISGRWWIETQDGNRIDLGPGDVHLGDDCAAVEDAHGRLGHDSGVTGDEPLVVMIVRVDPDVVTECVDPRPVESTD